MNCIQLLNGTTSSGYILFGDSGNNARGQIRYLHTDDSMRLHTAGNERMHIDNDGNVGIGTNDPSTKLDVRGDFRLNGAIAEFSTAANSTVLNRFWDNTGGVLLAELAIYDFSSSTLGAQLSFGQGISKYATLTGNSLPGGKLTLETAASSSSVTINGNGDTVFNESGAAFDFRIEGDTDANLFYSDASTDRIGIDTATPDYLLSVAGNAGFNEYIYHNGDADTYIRMRGDQFDFVAGGMTFLTLDESSGASADTVTVNHGDNDIDFLVNSDDGTQLIRTDAENNRVGYLNSPNIDDCSGDHLYTDRGEKVFGKLEGRWIKVVSDDPAKNGKYLPFEMDGNCLFKEEKWEGKVVCKLGKNICHVQGKEWEAGSNRKTDKNKIKWECRINYKKHVARYAQVIDGKEDDLVWYHQKLPEEQ